MRIAIFTLLIGFIFPTAGQNSYEDELNEGKVLMEEKLFSEALEHFENAERLNPSSPDPLYYQGMVLFQLERFEEAIGKFNKCVSLDPEYHVAYFLRGKSKDSLGQKEAAIADYDKSLASGSNESLSKIYTSRGITLIDLNKYEQAKDDLNEAVGLDPNNAEAYYHRAQVRQKLGYHNKYSIEDVDKAIQLNGTDARYYARKSELLVEANKDKLERSPKEQAVADASKAIELDEDNPEYYNIRSKAKVILDEKLGALQDLNKAVELSGGNDYYLNRRGLLKLEIRNYRGAVEDFTLAMDRKKNMEYVKNRGLAYYNGGKYQESILDFSVVIDHFTAYYKSTTGIEEKVITNILHNTHLLRGFSYLAIRAEGEACNDFNRSNELVSDPKVAYYLNRYCRL